MNDADRSPDVVLAELAPMLSVLATRGLYEEQPELWERGEELYAFCKAKLDAAEGRVEELARRAEQTRPAGGN